MKRRGDELLKARVQSGVLWAIVAKCLIPLLLNSKLNAWMKNWAECLKWNFLHIFTVPCGWYCGWKIKKVKLSQKLLMNNFGNNFGQFYFAISIQIAGFTRHIDGLIKKHGNFSCRQLPNIFYSTVDLAQSCERRVLSVFFPWKMPQSTDVPPMVGSYSV